MAQSPELQTKIQLWRQKSLDGTLTREEMKEAIEALREGRMQAAVTSAASKSRAKKAPVNSEDLLGELDLL
jgi:hypothetical protein